MLRSLAALALVALLSFGARAEDYSDDDGLNGQNGPPEQQQGPSIDDFRGDAALSSNGEWIDTPEYGTVWRPANVDENWRPYYAGRWAYTTSGWAWMSDEPFGWAVYHYGRWAFEPGAGWVWLPGSVWAPAWVSWRWGDGYAGWCPLGPRNIYYEQPHVWVFVEQRNFLQPVPHYAVPIAQGARVWAAPIRGPRAGPVLHAVEQQTGRGVRAMPIADAPRPRAAGPVAQGGAASFYRPRSAPAGQVGAPYMRASPSQVQPQRPPAQFGPRPGVVARPSQSGSAGARPAPEPLASPRAAPGHSRTHGRRGRWPIASGSCSRCGSASGSRSPRAWWFSRAGSTGGSCARRWARPTWASSR